VALNPTVPAAPPVIEAKIVTAPARLPEPKPQPQRPQVTSLGQPHAIELRTKSPPPTPLEKPAEIVIETTAKLAVPEQPRVEVAKPPMTGRDYTGVVLSALVILGVLLLLGGYSFDVNSFRFLGILFTTVAIVGAFFKLRYGIIVAPPRKKP
jgi:hypothetical protein